MHGVRSLTVNGMWHRSRYPEAARSAKSGHGIIGPADDASVTEGTRLLRYGWSLREADWRRAEVLLNDRQWARRRLRSMDAPSIPRTPGVYVILGSFQSASLKKFRNVLYVGKASALRSRFETHEKNPAARLRQAKTCFGPSPLEFWYVETALEEISDLEAALIEVLGPPVNQQAGTVTGVVGDPVDIGSSRVKGRS